jgi:uncharacterized protein (TIGR03032 family)
MRGFRPLWRPGFISELVAGDRCHLNGLATRDGQPDFATAASTTDHDDGWRDALECGGVVLDIQRGDVACSGLSLPHSPRLHDGRLWTLDSGRGRLGWVDSAAPPTSAFRPVAQLPGLTRGLALHGHWAFVGLSRPRYDIAAGAGSGARDTTLECFHAGRDAAWCGLQVIDLTDGSCIQWFQLDGAAREVYDVAVLPGVACARSVGPLDDDGLDLVSVEG